MRGGGKRRKLRRLIWFDVLSIKNEYRLFKLIETAIRTGIRKKEEKWM
jgi:hypothetical protein